MADAASDAVSRAVDSAKLAGTALQHDMSMWGLFMQADIVVKSVMLMLVLASIWSWAIILDKWASFKSLNAKANKFESSFWSGEPLEQLYKRIHGHAADPMARTFCAAMNEWTLSSDNARTGALSASLQQRIDRSMATSINREVNYLERYMTFLATVGSTAPFVGLFGTVWGIMNSFSAIAGSQNTSLAVVAPGIAEALFATALGLIAAIPAVVAYNKFSTDLSRYADKLDAFSSEFSSILSRHLEQQEARTKKAA
ncbi:MAG: protein TolQ [Pseudomonadota bacterium]|jgi:biopolymer transport protein TolQ|nr:protein TolQ [Pseudomonadota bacterium]QKK06066.1 MAG: protein TolQ [Pseudomonadota bacterium]